MILSLVGGIILALFGSEGKQQIMKESYGSIKKKANGAKSILSCKTLEVIITFAGRTGNLGNLGRGLGSLEWELEGRNNYMYSIEEQRGGTAGDSCLKNEKQWVGN